jgi:hypothetical protein
MASVELPASFFSCRSAGASYLDYWGELLNFAAQGRQRWRRARRRSRTRRPTVGADLDHHVQVAAPANDPEAEPLTFATTTDAATLAAGASA